LDGWTNPKCRRIRKKNRDKKRARQEIKRTYAEKKSGKKQKTLRRITRPKLTRNPKTKQQTRFTILQRRVISPETNLPPRITNTNKFPKSKVKPSNRDSLRRKIRLTRNRRPIPNSRATKNEANIKNAKNSRSTTWRKKENKRRFQNENGRAKIKSRILGRWSKLPNLFIIPVWEEALSVELHWE